MPEKLFMDTVKINHKSYPAGRPVNKHEIEMWLGQYVFDRGKEFLAKLRKEHGDRFILQWDDGVNKWDFVLEMPDNG